MSTPGAPQEHAGSEEHPTTAVTEVVAPTTWVTQVVAETQARREAANCRRREIRATQRQQLNEARQYGLRARHAAKEKP